MNALRYAAFLKRGLVHRGPPLHLTLFITGVCNARCRHCFHWEEVAAGVSGPSVTHGPSQHVGDAQSTVTTPRRDGAYPAG